MRLFVPKVVGLILLGTVLIELAYPGCDAPRDRAWEAAARNSSRMRLELIRDALLKYKEEHGGLPQGVDPKMQNAATGLSWRVHLLPYFGDEEKQLFEKFRLNEPWDSKHNLDLISPKPGVYESPIKGGDRLTTTCFLALVVNGSEKGDLLVVEADREQAVPWTKPADLDVPNNGAILSIVGRHQGQYLVLHRDGTIEMKVGRAN